MRIYMPFCTNCRSKIEDHHKFCLSYGAPIEKTPASRGGETPPPRKGILGDVNKEDIEEGVERGWRPQRRGSEPRSG